MVVANKRLLVVSCLEKLSQLLPHHTWQRACVRQQQLQGYDSAPPAATTRHSLMQLHDYIWAPCFETVHDFSSVLPILLLFSMHLAAGDVLAEVRREFELQKNKEAPYDIKYALSDGRTRLRYLEEMIGFSR